MPYKERRIKVIVHDIYNLSSLKDFMAIGEQKLLVRYSVTDYVNNIVVMPNLETVIEDGYFNTVEEIEEMLEEQLSSED